MDLEQRARRLVRDIAEKMPGYSNARQANIIVHVLEQVRIAALEDALVVVNSVNENRPEDWGNYDPAIRSGHAIGCGDVYRALRDMIERERADG